MGMSAGAEVRQRGSSVGVVGDGTPAVPIEGRRRTGTDRTGRWVRSRGESPPGRVLDDLFDVVAESELRVIVDSCEGIPRTCPGRENTDVTSFMLMGSDTKDWEIVKEHGIMLDIR